MSIDPMAIVQLVLAIAGGAIAGERYVNARFEKLSKEINESLDELNEDTAKLQTALEVMQERTNTSLKFASTGTEKHLIRLDAWCKSNAGDIQNIRKDLELINARMSGTKDTLDDVQLFLAKNFSYVLRKKGDR